MEHKRKPARNRTRNIKKNSGDKTPAIDSLALPNIAHLMAYGDITVGQQRPIGCIATACDEDQCLAMLVRRKGETLLQLLTRLDKAIAKAYGSFGDSLPMAVAEIVVDKDLIACGAQHAGGRSSDIASASCYEHSHRKVTKVPWHRSRAKWTI